MNERVTNRRNWEIYAILCICIKLMTCQFAFADRGLDLAAEMVASLESDPHFDSDEKTALYRVLMGSYPRSRAVFLFDFLSHMAELNQKGILRLSQYSILTQYNTPWVGRLKSLDDNEFYNFKRFFRSVLKRSISKVAGHKRKFDRTISTTNESSASSSSFSSTSSAATASLNTSTSSQSANREQLNKKRKVTRIDVTDGEETETDEESDKTNKQRAAMDEVPSSALEQQPAYGFVSFPSFSTSSASCLVPQTPAAAALLYRRHRRDMKVLAEWIQKRAEWAEGQYGLALAHLLGIGVPFDIELAIEHLKEAANSGHAQANYELGLIRLHFQGIGGAPQNLEVALKYFQEAENLGHPEAGQYVATLKKTLNATTR